MNVPLLDLVAQYRGIKDELLPAVQAVIESQQFIMGPAVAQLEAEIARLSRARHGIGCASGTDALLLPLKALALERGDEVITTPFSFFATAGTIHNAGGTPVFVDIDPETFNISPAAAEAALSSRTRALLPVHLFGQMAALERLLPLAGRREHAAYDSEALADVPQVRAPCIDPANEHIFHQYTLRVERRDELQGHLQSKGIGSAVYYPVPLHLQRCFSHLGYQRGRLPEAERAAGRSEEHT